MQCVILYKAFQTYRNFILFLEACAGGQVTQESTSD